MSGVRIHIGFLLGRLGLDHPEGGAPQGRRRRARRRRPGGGQAAQPSKGAARSHLLQAPFTLEANTTYWLVFDLDDAPTFPTLVDLSYTGFSHLEDGDPDNGWSIGNSHSAAARVNGCLESVFASPLRFAILGPTLLSNLGQAQDRRSVHNGRGGMFIGHVSADATDRQQALFFGPGRTVRGATPSPASRLHSMRPPGWVPR